MSSRSDSERRLEEEIQVLRQRLEDAEEMRRAIVHDEVDAFVVGAHAEGPRVRMLSADWERYREVLERVVEGAVTVSAHGNILYANQQFIDMVGEGLPELFDTAIERYVRDRDHAQLLALLGCGLAGSSMLTELRDTNGRWLPVKLSVASFSEGYASLLIARLPQRMEPNDAEETLEAIRSGLVDAFVVGEGEVMTLASAHRPWAIAMDHIGEGTATVSPQGEILYANQGFVSMLGVSREDLLGATLSEFMDGDGERFVQALGTREPSRAEYRLRRRDGALVETLVTVTPVGEGENACVVVSDQTDRKKHEALQELDRRKTQFIATLSHELRDPLGAVRTALALLDRSKEIAARDRFAVDLIGRQVQHMTRMVDDLLDMNRIEQGMIELQSNPTDLREVVEAAIESAMPLVRERKQDLMVKLPSGPVMIIGDAQRLRQAVSNLVGNAARYTPPEGRIEVEVHAVPLAAGSVEAVIQVRDTGIGISSDQLEQIFEPFVKATRGQGTHSAGLGLGLTLCRRLVELHGGVLSAQSEGIGFGTTMTVRLPAMAAQG